MSISCSEQCERLSTSFSVSDVVNAPNRHPADMKTATHFKQFIFMIGCFELGYEINVGKVTAQSYTVV
jgi:hypothetical protein